MSLGRLIRIPNRDLRHHAEDEVYFYTRVQFPHGGPGGYRGEEPWLLTDGDLRTGLVGGGPLGGAGSAGACDVEACDVEAGHVWFDTDGAGVQWNSVLVEAPRGLLAGAGVPEGGAAVGPVRVALALSDDRLERIRQRVERNREDVEANAPSWIADALD